MRKYYVAHVDFSEIDSITLDQISHDRAIEKLTGEGAIDEKKKPNVEYINLFSGSVSLPFFNKLERRMNRRRGGITGVRDTLQKLYKGKEYTAMYLLIAVYYGFMEWSVPDVLTCLPAAPAALSMFMGEFMEDFDEFIEDLESRSEDEDGDETDDESE